MKPIPESEWTALLSRIQSHSLELESGLARSSANLIHALSGLTDLDELTRSHLAPPPAPAPAKPAAPAAPVRPSHPVSSSAPSAAKVQYRTEKSEYAPALDRALDREKLVEALLRYENGLRARKQRRLETRPASPAPAGASTDVPRPRSDFAPMSLPEIQAEPKSSPLGASRAPEVRIPVLRAKPEGGRGSR